MYKRLLLFYVLLMLLMPAMPVPAQGVARIEITNLQSGSFPVMTVSLDAYNSESLFMNGLTADSVNVLEDGQLLPVESLEESLPGVQFIAAVNPDPSFARRDDQAVSRYDKIAGALKDWALALPEGNDDDLSLVTNDGSSAWHLSDPQDWLESLDAYQVDMRSMVPTLEVLSRAIEVASDLLPQPGMKRAVLFITPLPEESDLTTLADLAARAAELQIRVFVWVVESRTSISNLVTAMKDLAILTGGQYFFFSGTEELPDPEIYLEALRHAYLLTYDSGIRTAGNHMLIVQVSDGEAVITSSPMTFNLDLQPPNPILVSLPEQIIRQGPLEQQQEVAGLMPVEQSIEIIIEFPDGHPRALERTTLYVDKQVVAENTAEPFDSFGWDVSGYDSSGQHVLRVEAVDILGLERTSGDVPVQITILQPDRGFQTFLKRNSLWLAGSVVILAGVVLVWVLVKAGRRPSSSAADRRQGKVYQDPVTQPVEIRDDKAGFRKRLSGHARPAPAYLVRWKGDERSATSPPVPLSATETILGTDPIQATHVLTDPSVSPVHASIRRTAQDAFILVDRNSIAGTWVNFQSIQADGQVLEHGDLIHFGKLAYRFVLHKPPKKKTPQVQPVKDQGTIDQTIDEG